VERARRRAQMLPGVVDHHRGVVAGDAKINPEQANR
jgi:hypothetical protein